MPSTWIPKIVYSEGDTVAFELPPEKDPFNERYQSDVDITRGGSGLRQVSHNFSEKIYTVTFSLVSKAIKDDFMTFWLEWGRLGKSFVYWPDKDDIMTTETLELDDDSIKKISFDRMVKDGAGDFVYRFTVSFRRVE